MQKRPGTDGIICASPAAAMGAATAIERAGRTVGDEIDVTSKEAIPFLCQFRAPIMTLREDVARAGDFLARAAIQAIADPNRPHMQKLEVPTKLG